MQNTSHLVTILPEPLVQEIVCHSLSTRYDAPGSGDELSAKVPRVAAAT